ncbi:hypothetical protein BH10PSE2_BH10PSE2_16130 [soil metagenome]
MADGAGASIWDRFVRTPGMMANGDTRRDPMRVDYLIDHLMALHDAIARGVDMRGHMAWSLMDNPEWSLGYAKRFDITHVSFQTQERTLMDSDLKYAEVIRIHGGSVVPKGNSPKAPGRRRCSARAAGAFRASSTARRVG